MLSEIVYKYRDWKNPYHQKILTNRELFFSSTDQFNDPFELYLPIKINKEELTEGNLRDKYEEDAKTRFPELSESERQEKISLYLQKNLLNNKEHLRWVCEKTRKDFNSEFGVFCFGQSDNNYLMWSHYSDAHKGFCVGIELNRINQEIKPNVFGPVQYSKEFPSFLLSPNVRNENFINLAFTKSIIWEYEQEIRLVKYGMVSKPIVISPECFKEVILGCRATSETKKEISEFLQKEMPHVSLFESYLDEDQYCLNKRRIN